MTNRIASFSHTSQLLTNNLRLQSNYAQAQTQIASGFKSERYEGIAKDTSRLLNLESDFDRISQQSANAQIALDRTEVMYSAMTIIISSAQGFASDLSSSISGFGLEGPDLANNAQTTLNLLTGALNTQMADRFLFAGSATNIPPVDLNDVAFGGQTFTAPGPSVADFDYYQGNDYVQTVEATDGFDVNYGVTANNPAFELAIRAYDLIVTNPTDQDTIEEAFRLLTQAIDDTAVLQASISQRAQTLDLQINTNNQDLVLLETQISNIREVDLAETTTRLKQLETQLEASYTVTAQLLNLKLSDFIR
jgi:flagellar hook-associated protein 3 FlgL